MDVTDLERIALLLQQRNVIDSEIACVIDRPMVSGHLGEWIAAEVFDIELELNAATPAIDGRFRFGALRGRTVNVKWYLQQERVLDVTESPILDYYLVLTGPVPTAATLRDRTRPWCIESVYLFDAAQLLGELRARPVKIGLASSVLVAQWTAAEIYPRANNPTMAVTPQQAEMLALFAPDLRYRV